MKHHQAAPWRDRRRAWETIGTTGAVVDGFWKRFKAVQGFKLWDSLEEFLESPPWIMAWSCLVIYDWYWYFALVSQWTDEAMNPKIAPSTYWPNIRGWTDRKLFLPLTIPLIVICPWTAQLTTSLSSTPWSGQVVIWLSYLVNEPPSYLGGSNPLVVACLPMFLAQYSHSAHLTRPAHVNYVAY